MNRWIVGLAVVLLVCLQLVLPARSDAGLILADSVGDFSNVQGQDNWYYGFYDKTNDPDHTYNSVTDFQLMTEFRSIYEGPAWLVEDGTYWTSLWASGGHPNGLVTSGGRTSVEHFAIRRWVSDFSGSATISGVLAKLNTTGGNGIAGRIWLNGVHIYGQFISGTDGVGVDYSIDVDVSTGDTVDFMIDAWMARDSFDSTTFTATIVGESAPIPEPSTLVTFTGLLGMGLIGYWRKRRRK
jgi:hypothetical protein